MYFTFNIISLFCLVQLLETFKLKCPDSAHRRLRANAYCNGKSPSKYYCLFDENSNKFVESCHEDPDHVRPGEKYVITGLRRNINCSQERLQPFLFWSNASSECVFIRSQCNEVGQILYHRGTNKIDRSCRCDFRIGYDFIKRPKHKCFCRPLQEDCSCYLTNCSNSNQLTPDYECVHKEHNTIDAFCPPILHDEKDEDKKENIINLKDETQKDLGNWTLVRYGVSIFVLCLVLLTGLSYIILSVDCTKATPLNHDKYEITETITKKVDIVQHNHVATHTLSNGSSTQGGLSSENTILKNKIENIRRVIISQFDHFVETRAFHEILRILNKKHYVIIKGNPGDGKTTLAYFAMRRLIDKQNKKPLQLFSYLEWNKYVSPDENLAILIDNLFGEHSVSYDNVTHWSHRFPMIKATVSDGQHSNYVIICIRNDIFNQCQEMVYNEFFNSAMVDISHGNEFALNLDEMESIFRKYIPDNKLLLSKAKLSKFLQNIPTLGFPQCCHLYKHIEKLQKKGLDFFKNPLYFLEKELNARFHAKDMKMAVLVCVLLFGGNVNRSILYDQNQNRKLKESAMTMCSVESIDFTIFQDSISNIETSFLVHDVNEDMLKFAHSSIQKAVFLVVGKHNPDDLIQNCDYTLLSLISTPQCLVKSSESIVISEKSSRILMNRILELLTRSSSTVLQVISELNVWNDIHFFQKCLDFDESFVEAVDEDECSLFVHFSAAGCIKWVEHLYNMLVNKKQLIKALEEACGSNKLEIVIFLLGKNVVPNIRCCFNAARGGYLNILIALVEANSDLCREIDKTQSRWKNASYSFTVLEEAALFNQCHLIEPLLKLCPYLTTVRSSCNTTFIHVMAVAGNVELLKRFIENKTFSPYDKSDFNSTILHFACQSNRFETVKYIIETYPDLLLPEHYCFLDGTVLHTAAQSGNVIMFQYVHQKNIDILENKHITSIRLYDKNFVYDSNSRKNQTYVEISKLLHVRDGHGLTVLHAAAGSGSIELFKYVAKKSIDFLDERFTIEIRSILKYAKMRNNNEDMVSYLKETYNGIESDELSQSDSWND